MKDCEGNELKSGDFVRSNQGGTPIEIEVKDGICTLLNTGWRDFLTNEPQTPRLNVKSMAQSCWVKYPKP